MTGFLLGAILAALLANLAVRLRDAGRMQLFLTAAEQILAALQVPLRDVASKSAGRTVAAADVRPRRWFQALRQLADAASSSEPSDEVAKPDTDDAEQLHRWADDGGAPADEPAPDDVDDRPPAVLGPTTRPAAAVLLEHALADVTEPDDVDIALARFDLRTPTGHRL
jgi:hypothetical protein